MNPDHPVRRRSPQWNRRQFLQLAALAASPLPSILVSAAEKAPQRRERILVMLELAGGNDGLNTVIPVEDPLYHRARPFLGISESQALRLEKGSPLAFHPVMRELHELHREGQVTVVENVGYPESNRSHFRSAEIWHTARPESESTRSGWLARSIQERSTPALVIGDDAPPLALAADGIQVPALQNLDWLDTLFSTPGTRLRQMMREVETRRLAGELDYLQGATRATFTQLEKLEKIRQRRSGVEYPGSYLGRKLEWAGQLITGDYPSRIYYLRMTGFDTHARQKDSHERLLAEFSAAVSAFQKHLAKEGRSEEVVLVAFSEFGRRVQENGSQGTDHGSAGPVFVISGAARGGLVGEAPDLENLYRGDVRFQIDFRSLYATLLDEVVGVDSSAVLGRRWDSLPILKQA